MQYKYLNFIYIHNQHLKMNMNKNFAIVLLCFIIVMITLFFLTNYFSDKKEAYYPYLGRHRYKRYNAPWYHRWYKWYNPYRWFWNMPTRFTRNQSYDLRGGIPIRPKHVGPWNISSWAV